MVFDLRSNQLITGPKQVHLLATVPPAPVAPKLAQIDRNTQTLVSDVLASLVRFALWAPFVAFDIKRKGHSKMVIIGRVRRTVPDA